MLDSTIRAVNAGSVGSAAVSRNRFKEEEFVEFDIPLPPLDTQRAIVARWQAMQEEVATIEERVKASQEEIDTRVVRDLGLKPPKQNAAPKAFSVGWRDFLRWSVSYTRAAHGGTDLTKGRYPVVPFESILSVVQYGSSEKANKTEGVPILRINNIKNGVLDLSDIKRAKLPQNLAGGLALRDGDILIIRTSGSRDLVGTCAVFHESGDYIFASYLIRLRIVPEKADPDYVAWFINSALGREQVDATSRQIMQNNINSQELRNLEIPLPPLPIQRVIVRHIQARREEIGRERETAKRKMEEAKAEIEALILGARTLNGKQHETKCSLLNA